MPLVLWTWPRDCRAAIELQRPELELLCWWGDGRLRAAWLDSQTGALLRWAVIGSA